MDAGLPARWTSSLAPSASIQPAPDQKAGTGNRLAIHYLRHGWVAIFRRAFGIE